MWPVVKTSTVSMVLNLGEDVMNVLKKHSKRFANALSNWEFESKMIEKIMIIVLVTILFGATIAVFL